MPHPSRLCPCLAVALAVTLALVACASTDYLPVRYRLPSPAASLDGREVALQVVDRRAQESIFGPSTHEDFRHFTGHFALMVARGEEPGTMVGAVDLPGLFREAMTRRLERTGATVRTDPAPGTPVLALTLEKFILDRDGLNWIVRATYRAELAGATGRKAAQGISGREERFRVPGSKDVDRVLGDIFTTLINRLDLSRLFADAGL